MSLRSRRTLIIVGFVSMALMIGAPTIATVAFGSPRPGLSSWADVVVSLLDALRLIGATLFGAASTLLWLNYHRERVIESHGENSLGSQP